MLLTCNQCGKCCIEYGSDIIAAKEDIERWLDDGEKRILSLMRVAVFIGDEALMLRGDRLLFMEPSKIRFNSGELWFASDGKRLSNCPWLDENKCSIHHTKPAICRSYSCGVPL